MYQDLPYMDAIGMYVKKYDDKIHGYKIVVSPDAVLELDIIGPLNEDELMVYLL